MKNMLSVVILGTSMLTGCAVQPADVYTFPGQKQCNLAWERAQLKLASTGQLTVVTDVLMQGTYNNGVTQVSPMMAVRQNAEDGSCTITLKAQGAFGSNGFTDKKL